jgi:hypothetical protein
VTGRIGERVEAAARHARKVKEDHVRDVKGRRGRTDIMTIVEAWRGADVVGVGFVPPDRDRMLQVAHVMAGGFGADMVVLTVETFAVLGAKDESDPDTGETWAPNAMGEYFERHGDANGVVTEALTLWAFNRAGDEHMQSLPYRIVGRGVEWGETAGGAPDRAEGIIPDAMRRFMSQPTVLQMTARMGVHASSPEEEQALADTVAVKLLGEQQGDGPPIMVMMFAEPGSVRHQVLRRVLGRSAVQDPSAWN